MSLLNTLSNNPGAVQRKKRVGCGESSGHGKTSCRGAKGQMSRSGHKRKPNFEGGQMKLIRRIPKRGFNNSHGTVYTAVNVGQIAALGAGEVTPEALRAAGLLREGYNLVKVLGDGEISKAVAVKAHAFSAPAKAKIEAAGGSCIVID